MNKFINFLKKLIHPIYILISWLHKANCDECDTNNEKEDSSNE